MPEHRFDTIDNGVDLFNTTFAMFARLADDSIKCRTKSFSITDTNSVSFAHNIGQDVSELEVKIYINSIELKEEEIATYFSIVYDNSNQLTLTNISGSTKNGWLVVSGVLQNRADRFTLRERTNAPTSVPENQITIFAQNNGLYAKNHAGTILGLTDAQAIPCPPGAILPFAGASLPPGFLWCDGGSYNRADYPNLFAAIGTAHGFESSLKFCVPDYRGMFLRGVDGTAGRDPDKGSRGSMSPFANGNTGNAVGSIQDDEMQSHTHTQNAHNHAQAAHTHTQDSHNHIQDPHAHGAYVTPAGPDMNVLTLNTNALYMQNPTIQNFINLTTATNQSSTATNQSTTATNEAVTATNQNTGGNETRPTNAYVNYIIKY